LIVNKASASEKKDFLVVTSFNLPGYELYGKRFISSFHENWPTSAALVLTSEDEEVLSSIRKEYRDSMIVSLNTNAQKKFETRFKKYNGFVKLRYFILRKKLVGYDYRYDAQKFAKKTFALLSSHTYWSDYLYLIWIDADTITHSTISNKELYEICSTSEEIGYLGRSKMHSECGVMVFNLKSHRTKMFVKTLALIYKVGLFRFLNEYHDSFVFDKLRCLFSAFPIQLKFVNWNTNDVTSHPLINSHWGRFLDHLKGQRKYLGKSPATDLEVDRPEEYWKMKH
jgi:hypothetical protein